MAETANSRLREQHEDLKRAVGLYLNARGGRDRLELLQVLIETYDIIKAADAVDAVKLGVRHEHYVRLEQTEKQRTQRQGMNALSERP